MEENNAFLVREKLGTLMRKYAVPCVISLLVGALYNIVDQIFIANASYLGSFGNAANTVVFPLTVVALAIAVMIGDGCCAFVSISLGQNEVPKRYGFIYVNKFDDGTGDLSRERKDSFYWYKKVIASNGEDLT